MIMSPNITKADKGGAVVIQDVSDNISEANRQLNDNNFYVKWNRDLTHKHNKQVNYIIDSLHKSNLLTEKKNCQHAENKRPKNSKILHSPKDPQRK